MCSSDLELRVTLEAFGHAHKKTILEALRAAGYQARECSTKNVYD